MRRFSLSRLLAGRTEAAGRDPAPGRVALVGAGPGDPELLTLKARRLLGEADVVIHDRLVPDAILDLARRRPTLARRAATLAPRAATLTPRAATLAQRAATLAPRAAILVEVGKVPGGASWRQEDINALMVRHAGRGARVVRLKSGDPGVFGRLDEEMDALDAAGVPFEVVPGVTSAAAAAASVKVSLTRRGRNKSFRLLTGQDVDGFAEHDWKALAAPGAAAAVYMGVRAARFLQGRLMLHGAAAATPVTAVENASRPEQTVVAATLDRLPEALAEAGVRGPAILFVGLAPRGALAALARARAEPSTLSRALAAGA